MKNLRNINSWESLQEEKLKLEAQLEVNQKRLDAKVGRIKTNGRDVLVNKILLPVSVMGLGAVAARVFSSDNGKESKPEYSNQEDVRASSSHDPSEKNGSWFSMENIEGLANVIKIFVPVVLSYIAQKEAQNDE